MIFSDGITEARNASGEEFGEERLGGLLRDLWNLPAMQVCEAILAQVAEFGRGCPHADSRSSQRWRRPDRILTEPGCGAHESGVSLPHWAMGRRVAGNVPLIVAASAGLVLLLAGTLGWLGWRLLSQEETLLRQRSQDRLEQAADALLAGFLRTVADTESWLGQIGSAFPADADGTARRGGMLVMFSGGGVHTQPSGVLPYLPVSPPSVAVDSAVFQPSELLEFQLRDLNGAATLLTQLARRGNTLVRAEALLRLARVQAKARHVRAAPRRDSHRSR